MVTRLSGSRRDDASTRASPRSSSDRSAASTATYTMPPATAPTAAAIAARSGVSCPIAPAHTAATTPSAAAPTIDLSAVRSHRPRQQIADPALQQHQGEHGRDRVRAGVREREAADAERREERERQQHVARVLDRVDEERRARVLLRVEPAQREQVHGERHEPDARTLGARRRSPRHRARSKPPRTSTATAGCASTASATDDGTTASSR